MQALITFLKPFFLIVAHRVGPDVLPRSGFLLGLVIVMHILVYYLGLLVMDTTPGRTLVMPLLDTATQYAFFSVLVVGAGLRERLVQTLTAVFGADVMLNLISLPLAMAPVADPPALTLPVLASVIVLFWSLGVKGHILHRALGFPYFVGVLIACGFLIAFLALDSAIFGAPA